MKYAVVFLLILALCIPSVSAVPDKTLQTSASGAILIDAATGTVLYEKSADDRRLIASTTKVMTALIVIEQCSLDDMVEIPDEAAGVEGSSMYLTAGQSLSVRDLLYGLLLKSGNDAAVALSMHCDGSIDAFVERMNSKAEALGLKNTRFRNPHGLNAENHYSTARDMANLTRAALENETFSRIVSSKYAQINGVTIKNHNRMLWSYSGADGVKTGYTIDAGRCLISSATRDGMRLIAVTLNDRNDWDDHTAMLDFGFENYTLKTLSTQDEEYANIPVFGGKESLLSVRTAQTLRVLLEKEKVGSLETSVFLPRYLWAPVIGGQRVGMLTVTLDGEVLAQCPLIAGNGTSLWPFDKKARTFFFFSNAKLIYQNENSLIAQQF